MGKNVLSILEKALLASQNRPALDQDKFSILVVEDLDSPRDIICFYLESLGYKSVTGKSSAKEAMAELELMGQALANSSRNSLPATASTISAKWNASAFFGRDDTGQRSLHESLLQAIK